VDASARAVRRGGRSIALSAREYGLLEYLALRRGQVVTRAEIHDHVYDFAAEPGSNVVDVYVGYLRKKIDEGQAVKLIQTHRGLGYSLGARA
jgi:two-component system OmpR family response regulator